MLLRGMIFLPVEIGSRSLEVPLMEVTFMSRIKNIMSKNSKKGKLLELHLHLNVNIYHFGRILTNAVMSMTPPVVPLKRCTRTVAPRGTSNLLMLQWTPRNSGLL